MAEIVKKVDESNFNKLDSETTVHVNIRSLTSKNRTELSKLVENEKYVKGFLVTGKKLKERLRNQANGFSHIQILNLTIRMAGEPNLNEYTFSRICASIMIVYYEDVVMKDKVAMKDIIIPSLGAAIPFINNETIRKMMCLAGPGCQFLPRYFLENDSNLDDNRVGIMIMICGMIDWSNYRKSNKKDIISLTDFLDDKDYDDDKTTWAAAMRNIGEAKFKVIYEEHLKSWGDKYANIESRNLKRQSRARMNAVDESNFKNLDSETPDTVNIRSLTSKNRTELSKLVENEKYVKGFLVTGKKLEERLRNRANGSTHIEILNLTMRIAGIPNLDEYTFSRICASIMIVYYEDLIMTDKVAMEDIIIPSLGKAIPFINNETIRKMMCLAGTGCQFLPRYFLDNDSNLDDNRVGIMIMICGMIDWSNYGQSNIEDKISLTDFLDDEDYDNNKPTWTAAMRNIGEDKLKVIYREHLKSWGDIYANIKSINLYRKSKMTVAFNKLLATYNSQNN